MYTVSLVYTCICPVSPVNYDCTCTKLYSVYFITMEYTHCQVTVATMYTDVVSLYNVWRYQNSDTKCH